MKIYNVIKNNGKVTIKEAIQGLSDSWFNNGCRIVFQGSITECKQWVINSMCNELDNDSFVNKVIKQEDVEPGRAWFNKHQINPYDNANDPKYPVN